MSDGRGKTTDQIADAHIRKDGKPVTSAQVYAVICRYPSIFTKEAGRICFVGHFFTSLVICRKCRHLVSNLYISLNYFSVWR